MFVLAAMAVAISVTALRTVSLPRWLAPLGFLLAVSLVVSGVGYILLASNGVALAAVSLVLLLIFVTCTGVTLRVYIDP
jgi:hypothetical protein